MLHRESRASQKQAHYLVFGNSMVGEGSPEREVKKPISFSAMDSGYATSCLSQTYVNPGLSACMLICQYCDTGLVS